MDKKKLLILLLTISLCFPIFAFSETIVLKSGKTVEGKILEKTDTYIKIDIDGTPITYFIDEVKGIKEQKSSSMEDHRVNQEAYNYVQEGKGYGLNSNNDRKAIECFTKAIELDPQYAEAYEYRGMSYCSGQIQDFDSALADYNKVIELDPNNGKFYWGRALVYYYKKDYKNTWTDINKAEEFGFQVPPAFLSELRKVSERSSLSKSGQFVI
jgi:tetratricopeptide (TPR) repeat protein